MFRWTRTKQTTVEDWPLDMVLGHWNAKDVFRLSDAVQGILVLGSTGSGKSSGAAKCLIQWLLAAGCGGIALCVKTSDRIDMERYAKECGREDDLVIFGPDSPHQFNLLNFELSHGGKLDASRLENVVQLFAIILEIAEKDRQAGGSSGENKYFERAATQLLRASLLPLYLAGETISLDNIRRFIMDAPRSLEEAADETWRQHSYCYQVLCRADDQPMSPSLVKDFELSLLYIMKEFPSMDAKPRSSIVSTYSTMADLFQRGAIRDTFFSDTTITPDACREGKIFILDFPVLKYNDIGRIIQAAFKYVWQRAMERHDVAVTPRPVFLLSDEAQTFLTSFDTIFQATARGSRVATIYLTQNLPGMMEAVGGESGRHAIDALIGNLRLKIFHAQDDPVTCEWQSQLIGQTRRCTFNSNVQSNPQKGFDFFGDQNRSAGFSESMEYEIQPWEWSRDLRNGGKQNHYLVDAVAYQGGRLWQSNGKNFLPVTFQQ